MTVILEAEKLVKSYSGRRVVDELSLSVRKKSVLGLLGPNGAGKTTTLRMLYGFVRPESGAIRYDGRSFEAERTDLKRMIGVCTQDDTLDYDLSVVQNLRTYARYFRPVSHDIGRRIDDLLRRFGLESYRDASPHALSGGYKRRLLIARSIVHEPSVLFLDEPTTGLDPKARVDVWELVHAMREDGMAIILTTHYMDEAERLSDDLLVLSNGREAARGTPSEVVGRVLGEHVLVAPASSDVAAIAEWIETELEKRGSRVLGELRVALDAEGLARVASAFPDVRFGVRPPDLDDLFLALSIEPAEEEK
jgi:lipooligosaccharide transport system ATP-binding protein